MRQWGSWFRVVKNLPLKLSVTPFCQGLPGSINAVPMPCRLRSLSYQELQTLCNVNHETEVAFAVTGPRENEEVIGSACYFLSPTTNLAEVAFMVAPEFQGAGVGTALQARLQEYAMSRGVRGFVAEILPRNTRMMRLAARAPGRMATSRDEDGVHVTILFRDSDAHAAAV
jgi:GNAT superfamily N-acetyltransferase